MLTTDFVPGAPNWIDLGCPDVVAAAEFYGRALGWTHVSLGPEAGGYGFFGHEGRTVAAVGPLSEPGAASAWTIYFASPDADSVCRSVSSAGGKVRLEPFDVFTSGRMAQLTDPAGAEFAVWQAGDLPGVDAVSSVGALTWVELHSPDDASFYRTVFSWDVVTIPGAPGSFFRPAGTGEGAMFGAVVPDSSAYWLPYFEVADPDAAAAVADVVVEPCSLEGIGRIAVLADPFGARFGVMSSVTP
ncbi:VOC family protein [Lentzea sp. NPDC005914]|uniref:VOC family protein n=1 Tax=Lentzea sp. NPDC005914 TaxID=3154572 RepID=UPI0033E5593D